MTDKKSNDSRRKLLKSLAAGSGAVVAGKGIPESWSKPVINSVMLPAHAATTDDTGSLPTGTVVCSSLVVTSGSRCSPGQISFYVSGAVSASDGSSLEGVSLTVSYINGERSGPGATTTPAPTTTPGPEVTVTFTVLVGAGNTYSSGELIAVPPGGGGWSDPASTVSVMFTDPAYGTSTCSTEFICDERGEPM